MLPGDDGFLDGIGTANRGTVGIAALQIPGPDTLDPGDLCGDGPVGDPEDVTLVRSRGREDALELDAGHHVREPAVTVLGLQASLELLETRGQDDGTDVQRQDIVPIPVADGIRQADVLTEAASDALLPVDGVSQGDCLGVEEVDSPSL